MRTTGHVYLICAAHPNCPLLHTFHTGLEEAVDARVGGISAKVSAALGQELDTRFAALYEHVGMQVSGTGDESVTGCLLTPSLASKTKRNIKCAVWQSRRQAGSRIPSAF